MKANDVNKELLTKIKDDKESNDQVKNIEK